MMSGPYYNKFMSNILFCKKGETQTKICPVCKETFELTLAKAKVSKHHPNGYQVYCSKICKQKELETRRPHYDEQGNLVKRCSLCKLIKSIEKFLPAKEQRSGYSCWCQECNSKKYQKYRSTEKGRSKRLEYNRNFSNKYKTLLRTAKKRNLDVSITFQEYCKVLGSCACHYCGICFLDESGYGLDRKDNALHYHLDNLVPCCGKCNWMLQERPYWEKQIISESLKKISQLENIK
jgi:hypothetical protein